MKSRTIKKIITGSTQYDGAGVKLVRVFGYGDTAQLDPFLMMDAFDSEQPEDYIKGFPWHPHRGIETVTYLIHGRIDHSDNLGNEGSILDGGCQWMTAGGGILHQEMPQPSGQMLGVQLWLNLPREQKMVPPQYRDIKDTMIPAVEESNGVIRIISGEYKGTPGGTQGDYVKASFLDVDLQENADWSLEIPPDQTVFAYIVRGEGTFGDAPGNTVAQRHGILFGDGEQISVHASGQGIRFLLLWGQPLHEPIAWGGPIVMNTREELNEAFRQLDEGTFIQKK